MEFDTHKDIKKTRKPHYCTHCNLTIPNGVACNYDAGKYDGDFFSCYAHKECDEYWRKMNQDAECGDEWQEMAEHFSESPESYPEDFAGWRKKIGEQYGVSP